MNAEPTTPAEPTPLERQQIQVARPDQATFWHRVRFELASRVATRSRASTVLDIGAGSGQLGDWLLAHRPEVEYRFEELSPVLDRQLVDRFGASRRSASTDPIAAGTTVVLLDVLEHIDDDLGALRDVHRRMAAGTRLVITVPALQWAFSSWDVELGHHRRYSRGSLRRLVAGAGFHVDEVGYLFPELLPLLPLRLARRAPRTHVDFPHVGRVASTVGYLISSATAALRRFWPAGTSVVLVATRPA